MCQREKYYWTPEAATHELAQRRALRAKVEAWWSEKGWGNPSFLTQLPLNAAVIARHVATARFEDIVFALLSQKVDLTPVWLEYLNDHFSDRSDFKRALVKRHIFTGRGKRSGEVITIKESLVEDMVACKKLNLIDITTRSGENLVDFHHRWQSAIFPNALQFDISDWYKKAGGRAADYYSALLSLFVAHAVLFENYHGGESGSKLDDFTKKIFEPAWEDVTARFGVKPLLTPLPWQKEFAFYPQANNWQASGIIPPDLL